MGYSKRRGTHKTRRLKTRRVRTRRLKTHHLKTRKRKQGGGINEDFKAELIKIEREKGLLEKTIEEEMSKPATTDRAIKQKGNKLERYNKQLEKINIIINDINSVIADNYSFIDDMFKNEEKAQPSSHGTMKRIGRKDSIDYGRGFSEAIKKSSLKDSGRFGFSEPDFSGQESNIKGDTLLRGPHKIKEKKKLMEKLKALLKKTKKNKPSPDFDPYSQEGVVKNNLIFKSSFEETADE